MSEQEVFSVIHQDTEAGQHRLELRGELDLMHADVLDQAVSDVRPGDTLILDLRPLVFMDSTGIRHLMTLHTRAHAEGWTLQLIPGNETIQRVFVLCGLDRHLPFISA